MPSSAWRGRRQSARAKRYVIVYSVSITRYIRTGPGGRFAAGQRVAAGERQTYENPGLLPPGVQSWVFDLDNAQTHNSLCFGALQVPTPTISIPVHGLFSAIRQWRIRIMQYRVHVAYVQQNKSVMMHYCNVASVLVRSVQPSFRKGIRASLTRMRRNAGAVRHRCRGAAGCKTPTLDRKSVV